MRSPALLVAALALALAAPAGARANGVVQLVQAATAAPMATGEVRRIDKDAAKITLRHDEIPSLEMPPMTMVFRVSDKTLLDSVKVGDAVRFTAEKIGGQYTITRIEPAR